MKEKAVEKYDVVMEYFGYDWGDGLVCGAIHDKISVFLQKSWKIGLLSF